MNTNSLYSSTFLRAFDIIDCFENDEEEIGISEIASMINLPVSSVHRIIQSLEFEGLLIQNPENKKYGLGTRFLALSHQCSRMERFRKAAVKYIDALARITKETVNLSICTCDQIQHVYKVDSSYVLRPNFSLFTPFPAHNTSVGRVFLAEMNDASIRWVWEKNKEEISQTQDEFLNMLHQVKAQGFALDDQDFNKGLRCCGAPVRLSGGNILFAISISGPAARISDSVYKDFQKLVVEYAQRIADAVQALE